MIRKETTTGKYQSMPRKKPLEMCLICFIISDMKSYTAMQYHYCETQQATIQNSTYKKEQCRFVMVGCGHVFSMIC